MEVMEAAYDISCPDSTCDKQGILTLQEIESLVSTDLMEKHRKFRLDKGKIYFLNLLQIQGVKFSHGPKTKSISTKYTRHRSYFEKSWKFHWSSFEKVYFI